MPYKIGGKGGTGGGLAVKNKHIFPDNSARDAYFANNPLEQEEGLHISVNKTLQKYIDGMWTDMSAVVKGDPAPAMKFQFSANGDGAWENVLNTGIHRYWRWSIDDGLTWSPNYVPFSGGGSGSVPAPYSMSVSPEGKLQLYKYGTKIQEQDETGTWISESVQTGVGSFHLGKAHSISSTGQNVGFKNEYTSVNDANKLFFFPTWEAVSVDGLQTLNATTLKFQPLTQTQPNGNVTALDVLYDFNITSGVNFTVFSVSFVPSENYKGVLRNIIYSNVSTEEIYNTPVDVDLTAGVEYTVLYKYPFFVRTGDTLRATLTKANNTPLSVKAGSNNNALPWRRLSQRFFEDSELLSFKEPAKVARSLEQLTDAEALDVFKLKNVGLLSKGNYRGELPTTLADLANSSKGDWWKASAPKTLGGTNFAIGDELYCINNTVMSPSDLTNFSVVVNVSQLMSASTATVNGQAGIVPPPPSGDVKVLTNKGWGDAQYKDITLGTKYKLIVDNGIPYLEEVT